MTAQEWITAFADALGTDAPDDEGFAALLELAAEAAHASERVAAPIACYLAGKVGADIDSALEAARRVVASD
jgi:hypothetical protein